MIFLHYLTLFVALSGIHANVIYQEEMTLPADYKYVPHPIANINDKLHQKKTLQIYSPDQIKTISWNGVIDDVIAALDKVIVDEGLDPFNVYTGTILGVDVDVWIGGFSNIVREGDASVQINSGTTAVTCSGNITNLVGNLTLTIRFLGFVVQAGGNAQVESVDFNIALRFVQMDNGTQFIQPFVDNFEITDIGKVTVQVFGLGPLNPFINIVADFAIALIKFLIPVLLNGIVKDVLQQILNYIFHTN